MSAASLISLLALIALVICKTVYAVSLQLLTSGLALSRSFAQAKKPSLL